MADSIGKNPSHLPANHPFPHARNKNPLSANHQSNNPPPSANQTDRVFVHALNTVKKIPKTGAARPPPSDRMRLYGLYKQAMEGDVDGVMERPTAASLGLSGLANNNNNNSSSSSNSASDDVAREQDKWDAWSSQKGISRTEAKRRYVEALIDTMHKYANTPNALELVAELEFVWNQIKSNSNSNTSGSGTGSGTGSAVSSGLGGAGTKRSTAEGAPMRVLRPMSEEDETEERRLAEELDYQDDEEDEEDEEEGEDGQQHQQQQHQQQARAGYGRRNSGANGNFANFDKRTKRMERAIVRLSAEIAALREQISTGREWRSKKQRSFTSWAGWALWWCVKHFAIDFVIIATVLIWMRKRRDRRLEDYVRGVFRLAREYLRKILPAR